MHDDSLCQCITIMNMKHFCFGVIRTDTHDYMSIKRLTGQLIVILPTLVL